MSHCRASRLPLSFHWLEAGAWGEARQFKTPFFTWQWSQSSISSSFHLPTLSPAQASPCPDTFLCCYACMSEMQWFGYPSPYLTMNPLEGKYQSCSTLTSQHICTKWHTEGSVRWMDRGLKECIRPGLPAQHCTTCLLYYDLKATLSCWKFSLALGD